LTPQKLALDAQRHTVVPETSWDPIRCAERRDGRHIAVLVSRDGELTRRWNPLITRCHESHLVDLAAGASLYGAHLISASTSGWLIDEPGFYKLQAAVDVDGAIVVSNVLRIFVSPPATKAESQLAPDYFTEEVGRAIAFDGAP
jgi:hypothetical protein